MVFQVAAQNATGELGGPAARARNFSLLALGYSVSGFLGPLAAGFAIDHIGFRAAFGAFALIPLIPVAVLARGGLPFPGGHPRSGAAHRGGVLALFRHRTLRRVFAINALLSIGWDLHTIFVPIYGAKIGLSASRDRHRALVVRGGDLRDPLLDAGDLAPAERATGAHGGAAGRGRRLPRVPVPTSVPGLLLLSFVLGLGLGSGQPMVMSLLHTHAPPGRMGEAAGVRMSVVQAMAVAVPLVFGAVGASIGIAPVFWSVGACLVTGGGPRAARGALGSFRFSRSVKCLRNFATFGRDHQRAVGLARVAREVLLVVALGLVERRRAGDLGDDRILPELLPPRARAITASAIARCSGRLAEDHRAVLRADVVALPVGRRRVVDREEHGRGGRETRAAPGRR